MEEEISSSVILLPVAGDGHERIYECNRPSENTEQIAAGVILNDNLKGL